MSKKILIINSHPNEKSFNFALSSSYAKGALSAGAKVEILNIKDLKFNPNLEFGYAKKMDTEPDLEWAISKLEWANHFVIVHPVWWGSYPALLKGFIDRTFLPGVAFNYKDGVIEKLFKYKSGRIIVTLDQPSWWYKFINGQPSTKQLRKNTLNFCGVSPVYVNYFGIMITSTQELRERWLEKVYKLGIKDAN